MVFLDIYILYILRFNVFTPYLSLFHKHICKTSIKHYINITSIT